MSIWGAWKKFLGNRKEGDLPPKITRRQLGLLGGLVALGVLLLVLGSISPPGKDGVPAGEENNRAVQESPAKQGDGSTMARQEAALEAKLREMLAQVEGAGEVKVTVRLASSSREEYAVNTTTGRKTTEEKDQAGGTRVTSEDTGSDQLVLIRSGQGEVPVVEQEIAARVAGVLVVADGAEDPLVKARLFEAVQVALGVEPQKILVLPRQRGKI
ncbi:stage III sporulation protein AG [Desulfofundulus australicus DSM 11792]|uniref:Stage III sporulation protein AG n=1 Tax=Desulfofundulus australicus DSM 11792 TaxID=1121425 RepID=A0A1M5CUQ3_9FIRM|nr:hypothetical protein [Desulfofundulus australicus]SHF58347.1 stage III sporulation protein AG [Desulfofundulus australicus DSM 11792]